MITLDGLHKTYTTKQHTITALDDIHLEIHRGDIFGIIGESGAGKSTLLRCINLLEQPDQGRVLLDGNVLNSLSNTELNQARRNIGMIFQHFNLIHSRNVYDNIALPLKLQGLDNNTIKQRIEGIIDLVGLNNKQLAYPNQLSGGQKQRVAIARALSTQPKILLCDEATSALDPQTTSAVLDLLKQLHQQLNLTIVLITHEMDVIKSICNRVAVMESGRIIEQAPIFELFSQPQQTLTKRLVADCIEQPLPSAMQALLSDNPKANTVPLLKIRFYGSRAQKPLISEFVQTTGIVFNILQANYEYIDNQAIGVMLVSVMTTAETLPTVLAYCQQQGLTAEVIGYVPANVD